MTAAERAAVPPGRIAALTALGVAVIAAGLAFVLVGAPSPARLRDLVGSAGPSAPLLFVPLCAALVVVMAPKPVVAAAAGLAFGPAVGTVVAVAGTVLGAAAAFLVARLVGRDSRLTRGRLGRLDAWVGDHGFVAVLYARLIPVLPFGLVNYVAGVSRVRLPAFVAATAVGSTPATFAAAGLAGSLDDLGSPAFRAALAVTLLLAAVPLLRRQLSTRAPRRRSAGVTGPTTPPGSLSDDHVTSDDR